MIQDHTLDETLVELARTLKALQALRATRKATVDIKVCTKPLCFVVNRADAKVCERCGHGEFDTATNACAREHAAAKRASLDLTRKLADLRAGR